ncbi:MAG: hypothetical protein AAGM27_00785 [Cyanobacteria bacterium J06554_3]
MEPILIISNLVLVGLTGTYAWLTSKNLKQLQKESGYYRSVVEKQLRLTALPHLYWDLQATKAADGAASLALEVFNISNVPAYDVHVSLIGAYTEEALGIATFMRTHVQPRHRKYPLQSDKVGYYGVRNAVRLSLLPTQQKIVLSLPFPLQPADVYTLVQYRELSGENYYQVCCFSAIDESGTYRANILEPSEMQTMERLHLFDLEDFALPEKKDLTDPSEEPPYYLADFIDLWNHSISSRLISDPNSDPNSPASPEEEVPVKATYDF